MLIMVDIDATLYNSTALFNKVSLELGYPEWLAHSYWTHSMEWGYDIPLWTSLFSRCHDRDNIFSTTPYPGSVEVLQELSDQGHTLYYVTSRKPESYEATQDWLKENEFPQYENLKADLEDKNIWIGTNRPGIVIDDRVKTMMFAAYETGAEVFSLETTYNINMKGEHKGIHLYKDWYGIGEGVQEYIGKLVTA